MIQYQVLIQWWKMSTVFINYTPYVIIFSCCCHKGVWQEFNLHTSRNWANNISLWAVSTRACLCVKAVHQWNQRNLLEGWPLIPQLGLLIQDYVLWCPGVRAVLCVKLGEGVLVAKSQSWFELTSLHKQMHRLCIYEPTAKVFASLETIRSIANILG